MADSQQNEKGGAAASHPLIECIPNGLLAANCYIVACPRTRQAALVDPGAEPQRILHQVESLGVTVAIVVHTHGHFDHIGATETVLAGLPARVPLAAHPADAYLYQPQMRQLGIAFGYPLPEMQLEPDLELVEGGKVEVGDLRLHVLHTPGHTPGSVSLWCAPWWILTGDTLFRRGIGRTDLPGGDEDAIYDSIATRLYPLPSDLVVYPGHGDPTTIGEERQSNPFVRG
jgi:glyoxylase-like metal-dependent hydrolase (beta-lactamase superfamily II)